MLSDASSLQLVSLLLLLRALSQRATAGSRRASGAHDTPHWPMHSRCVLRDWNSDIPTSEKVSQLTCSTCLQISKALVFLKQRDLVEAVEILKSFEKKETTVATAAATNLSFLFYLVSNGEYFSISMAQSLFAIKTYYI